MVNRRTLGVSAGSVLAFLMIMGAARGAVVADAHDRAAPPPLEQSTIALVADAHARGTTLTSIAPASSTAQDASDRAAPPPLEQSTIALVADAHARGTTLTSIAPASSTAQDASDRAAPVERGTGSPASIADGSSISAWGSAFGAALVLAALASIVLLVVRRSRRLALS